MRLVEAHTMVTPSYAHSFNALRIFRGIDSTFAKLSTSKHRRFELIACGKHTPYSLNFEEESDECDDNDNDDDDSKKKRRRKKKKKKKKSKNKNEGGSGSAAPPPLPGETVLCSDAIGGNGESWDDWGAADAGSSSSCLGLEVAAVRRGEGLPEASTFALIIRRRCPAPLDDKDGAEEESQRDAVAPFGGSSSSQETHALNYAPLCLHLTYLPRALIPTLTLLVSSHDSTIHFYQPTSAGSSSFAEVVDGGLREKVRWRVVNSFQPSNRPIE